MGRRGFLAAVIFLLGLVSALVLSVRKGPGLPPVIPAPGEGIPFLFFEGQGKSFDGMRQPLLSLGKKAGGLGLSLDRLFPLLAGADEVAALFTAGAEGISFNGVLRFGEKGSPNGEWRRAPEWAELHPAEEEGPNPVPGLFVLKGPPPLFPLYFAKAKDLVMIGSSPGKIRAMTATLEKGEGGMAISWGLERRWPNHFYLYDGGMVSRLLSKVLPGVRAGRLSLTGAWRFSERGGRLKWSAEGAEALFPGLPLDGLEPVKWDGGYLALDPFIASFGINLPYLSPAFIEERGLDLLGLKEAAGFRGREIAEISAGPVVGSLCGRGKLLIFPLPGVLFQLPGRGEAGEAFARSFWKKEWTSLVPEIEKTNGFTEGGAASIPFSIVCEANRHMLRMGIVDGDLLKYGEKKTIAGVVPLLKESGRSLFWAYADGPAVAGAMESLLQTDSIAGKAARGMGINLKTASRVWSELEKIGIFTVILPSLGEGTLEWEKKPESAGKE